MKAAVVHSATTDWAAAAVGTLPGVGPKRAESLANLGIYTVADLIRHFPRDYEDRRDITPIADVAVGMRVTIRGCIKKIRRARVRWRRTLAEAVIADDTAEIRVVWFGMGYLADSLSEGAALVLTGAVTDRDGPLLQNPTYDLVEDTEDNAHARLTPLYPLTEGLTPKQLRHWIAAALQRMPVDAPDPMPEPVRAKYGYLLLRDALRAIHSPQDIEEAKCARERFVYEE
ncbi:MAG: OB-fold nucleic acid binding domain-containing protein, partial [Candidatus Hydrogenedentales bacterium]